MAKRNLFLCCLWLYVNLCLSELVFSVDEERPNGTIVGNISDSSDIQTLLSDEVLGSLKYSFLVQGYPHSALFTIVNNTGIIYTAEKLDREKLCGFSDVCHLNLEVAIQSTTSRFFRKEKVKVILNDVNDNKPEFSNSAIVVEISESVSVNSSYQLEAAVDRDVGNNSLRGYELISYSDVFGLKAVQTLDGGSVVSLVVIKSLDREQKDWYNVTVIAHDGGVLPLSSSLLVNVKIKDVNDNRPKFSAPRYNVSVKEVSAIGSVVVQLNATDADTSEYGVALYRFSPLLRGEVTKYFSISATTGTLTVRSPLDLVQGKTMECVVECFDHGSPPLVAQALVTINIEDTTNDRPVINLNLLADGKVSEYAQPGTPVAHIAVLDPDTGRNGIVRCMLLSSVFELQGLDVDEYKITVAKAIDSETHRSFAVTLTCEDAGEPPLNRTVSFTVEVKDENDNKPLFSQSRYRGNITENNLIGEVILTLSADDRDSGVNGELTFSSPEGDKLGLSVTDNGQIISKRKFNREQEAMLIFEVIVTDHGDPSQSSSATVQIDILDVNDVSPTFTTSTYVFEIFENKPANSLVGRVVASDDDEGLNGQLHYSIFREDGDDFQDLSLPFVINSKGEIRTTKALDRENRRRYEFVVVVRDGGDPVLHGSATVIVDVEDRNDNKPIITSPSGVNNSVALPYTTPAHALIVALSAKDADFEDNGRVSYLLAHGNPVGQLFTIGTSNGLLKTKRELNIEDVGIYNLVVIVKDGGVPPLVSNITIDVIIFAANDTGLPQNSEENALVVIILGTLTGVISIAVIITIIIIRTIDRKRKQEQTNLHANSGTISPEDLLKLSGATYLSSKSSGGDLSFDSTHSNNSVNGSNDSKDKLLKDSSSDSQDNSRQLSSISGGKLVSFGPNQEWPTAVKLHKDLLKLHHIDFKESSLGLKQSDDANSDSSGEITGTDSGRGGSEEDSHSNGRASPTIPKIAPRKNIKSKPPTYPEHIENQKKHSGICDASSSVREDTKDVCLPLREDSHYSLRSLTMPRHESNYSLRNVSFPARDDSNYSLKNVCLPSRDDSTNNLQNVLPSRQDSNYSNNNNVSASPNPPIPKRQPMKKHVSFQSDFCQDSESRKACDSFRDQSVFKNYPGTVYSAGMNGDRSFEVDDDDNSTTTSGSYMVDMDNETTDYIHSRMKDVVV